jgi:hypothetical protein
MANGQEAVITTAKLEAQRKAALDRFMSRDETKLLVSMVPATNPPELLITLIRSAFQRGHDEGIGAIGAMVAAQMMSDLKRGGL